MTHFQAIFETNQLPILIKFQCPKLLKFHAKLNSNQYSIGHDEHGHVFGASTSNPLDKYVKYEYDEENLIVTFVITLPNEGQYGLDIYARDPDYQTEKRTMSHCCKYIINCTKAALASSSGSTAFSSNPNQYHDYSFDRAKNNDLSRLPTPRAHSTLQRREGSQSSPRKCRVTGSL